MQKKITIIKYLIITCLVLISGIINQNIAHAEEIGCCILTSNAGGFEAKMYRATTESECFTYDVDGKTKIKGEFHADQVASEDGKSCVNKTANMAKGPSKLIPPVLSVSIPGFGKFSEVKCDNENPDCAIPWIAEYLSAIFEYSIKIIGILAIIVIMLGGILWLTAAGSKERLGQAMNFIKGGVLGITIALCSYALLFILNPNLVILKSINVNYIKEEDLSEIEDTSEPVTQEQFNKNPNRDKIDPDSSKWIKVPDDKKGLGITTDGAQLTSGVTSIEGLKKAAECFRKLDSKNYIRVVSASRTKEQQLGLWRSNCCSGRCKCSPPTCNPNNGNCPHTMGVAFDAWACNDKGCKMQSLQYKLQNCFFQAGFCLLASECWHFENPQFSGSCYQKNHYTGKYCTKPNQ